MAMVETLKLVPDCAWTNDATIYPDGFFDVVYCIHTIEHFTDTLSTMLLLKRLLKKDGWLVMVIPYLDHEWHEHYKIWGKAEIEELFEPFSCDVSIIVREALMLDKAGNIFVKRYTDGTPFQEAVCFVKFKN
jgi:SAM-dependent methyltransferase